MATGRDPNAPTERVATFPTETLARLCAGRLGSEGVPAMVRSIGPGPALWNVVTSPHEVMVRPRDAERARAIVADVADDTPPLEVTEREWTNERHITARTILTIGVALLVVVAITLSLLRVM